MVGLEIWGLRFARCILSELKIVPVRDLTLFTEHLEEALRSVKYKVVPFSTSGAETCP